MDTLKVLISAYSCLPGMGSEPGVGWNTMRELVKHHKVWVITRNDNRSSIETELASNPVPGLSFIYCDLPHWIFWTRSGQQLHYYLWQLVAYFFVRRLHQDIRFDLVHHITYVKYWSPSFLSLLPIPFIWGPVGGAESTPKAFWQDFSFRGKAYEMARDVARWFGERDPFVRATARRSVLARATTEDTAQRLRLLGARNVEVFSETGLSQTEIAHLAQYQAPKNGPVRFISMGRLLHWKGFHLGLQAFALAALPDAEYWICGDGPERDRLQALAETLNIAHQIKFWGRLPRDLTLEKLGESHILLHPSLHDSGGWVCLEAMAVGRPAVCLNLGGPASQVTEETGFKVPAEKPEQAICDLATAMVHLANAPDLRLKMGLVGQRRVREEFSWETKGQRLAQLYVQLLEAHKSA
jgi:glycosyltransferase involved in cell wall biosynthesis